VQKKVGPAWTERGRSPAGYFTKRTAEGWLRDRLDEARRGGLPGGAHSGATFAEAATEWLTDAQYSFGGVPPIEMARTDVGAQEVERLIGQLEHGVFP
jgi:hypothetical protein